MKNNKKITLKNGVWSTKKDILEWLEQQLIDNMQYEVDEDNTWPSDKDLHKLAIKLITQLKLEDK